MFYRCFKILQHNGIMYLSDSNCLHSVAVPREPRNIFYRRGYHSHNIIFSLGNMCTILQGMILFGNKYYIICIWPILSYLIIEKISGTVTREWEE